MRTTRLNREIVIQCAMELVYESGINGLRLNKIADRLDVKSPSLYTHTGSVTELRQAVIHQAMQQFREALMDSLMGRATLGAFLELGKTWMNYANEQSVFYTSFYNNEYSDFYAKNISHFLQSAFKRIFVDWPLNEEEVKQIERIMTNYFCGQIDRLNGQPYVEAELISDLEIFYQGIVQKLEKVSQVC
ncbi:TetR/AcrR family transcriptional regulator [Enterococcus viikkiensis]|uniref:TetR/AcrR family transcriptional regulator n=1 Tax=Enterococcus viikkiensis TaxID=930854 RepID=UPI0010FA3474|nr:TetR family transcriptional regulator [Enterococcus viikkiensis]